jgi:hypothetical protein
MSTQQKILYLVHCVDTEGPLYESLEATSQRLKSTFGLDIDIATSEDLEAVRNGAGVPDSIKNQVNEFISRICYNENWNQLDEMLGELFSQDWRMKYKDDFDQGYLFNWFILDHVGFTSNPRRRALGYHNVYDHYRAKLKQYGNKSDRLFWHFHPTSYFHEAHKTSNNFSYSNEHLNTLSRRIIDDPTRV